MAWCRKISFAIAALLCCLRYDAAQYDTCTNGTVADIGNGQCDAANNNPSCGYDGGDCCSCTCGDGPVYSCADSDFNCIFPECGDPVATSDDYYQFSATDDSGCDPYVEGDRSCNDWNNDASCNYDEGDCCACTCEDYDSDAVCGVSGFNCRDPACFDPAVVAEFPDCTGNWLMIGDGDCQSENNNVSCGYDGGDCCACSCSGSFCINSGFDCLDPEAQAEVYECKAPPAASLPCSGDVQRVWVVDDSAQATALAAAANCSGGSFEVEWRGSVVVHAPIYVANGTVLTVTGDGSNAVINGNASTRLFTVVNAALHVRGVNISYGASTAGGAIAAAGSTLTFEQTYFIGNRATGNGGAIHVSDGSNVSCGGGIFANNSAGFDGGAMYVAGGSLVSCSGSWLSNVAGDGGGALMLHGNSSVYWSDVTDFAYNVAARNGGAVYALYGSSVSWNASTYFRSNSALFFGGAVSIGDGSKVSWTGPTTFDSNSATSNLGDVSSQRGDGGALAIWSSSSASWAGVATFTNNVAGAVGGGMVVYLDSHASCTGETVNTFSENSAYEGGALAVHTNSSISFGVNSSFDNNTAISYGSDAINRGSSVATWNGNLTLIGNMADSGGALYAYESTLSWNCTASMIDNNASRSGGALYADDSIVSWLGETEISNSSGGAVYMTHSTVSWTGNTTLAHNRDATGFGGAIAAYSSHLCWEDGYTKFIENYAGISGGALWVFESNLYWNGDTEFVGNSCGSEGSALYATWGTSVSWGGGTTSFSRSYTLGDGTVKVSDSSLAINGTTTFSNNTVGGNGGGLALLGESTLDIGTVDVSFVGNVAAVAGGALLLSGTGGGPLFTDVSFISNSAEIGGAASISGYGNEVGGVGDDPTTFDRCRFIGNRATATGGAISTAAGQEVFANSIFEGNSAGTGGALRLASTTYVYNSSFVENTSDDREGAAVSNIGYLAIMKNISFSGNGFNCPSTTFLEYTASNDPFQVVCDGCETTCDVCVFVEGPLAPICTEVMDHSTSNGGNVTLEEISIQSGYWRATGSSTEVLACYHADACLGGVTGTSGYCLDGYEGPYCSICSDGYTAQLSFVCSKCSENSVGGIVVAIVLAIVALCVAVAVVAYVTSGEAGLGAGGGVIERLTRYIPLQSVKIVIVAWQILTQFSSVANVKYPDVYQEFLDGLDVFNFDLGWLISAGCFLDIDFHDRLLVATITPVMALLFLACTYATAARINRGSPDNLQTIWHKHVSMVLLLTFLVYSSVSSTLFKTFACETLDDGKNYVRSDYRLDCDSAKHKGFQVYAGFMIVLYTVGIPALYFGLLFRDRVVLRKENADREDPPRVTSISGLWKQYKPSAFYYEVIECARRVLLAGVVVFIYPNTAAQIAVTLMIAFTFVLISEGLAPYASKWDTWIGRTGHVVVFISMYVALLLKVDVSDERDSSQKVFEAVLVAVHALMLLLVVLEAVVVSCSLKVEQKEDPCPRIRGRKWLDRREGRVRGGGILASRPPVAPVSRRQAVGP